MSRYFWAERAAVRTHGRKLGCAVAAALVLGLAGRAVQADGALGIVVDSTSVSVPEGGTGTFRVKLSAQPGAPVLVNAARVDGDADISIQAGTSLTFTPVTWDTYQTVTLKAAQDGDVINGQATIRCTAIGLTAATVIATEAEDDVLGIAVDQDVVVIPEGTNVPLSLRLTGQPAGNVTVSVERVSGDTDLQVPHGTATLTFTPANWDTYQQVSLFAAQDLDTAAGEAVIRCRIAGGAERLVTVREADDDTLRIVTDTQAMTVPEGGSAAFRVKLNAPLTEPLTILVSRLSGDPNLTIERGSSLVFTPANWNEYQPVTLAAAWDYDTMNGQAVFMCSGAPAVSCGLVATEEDHGLGSPENAPDVTAPTVEIANHVTDGARLSISGTAADDVGVTEVSWANNRGGAGLCTGTESWSASGIPLLAEANEITVTAKDAAGHAMTSSIIVWYTPPDSGTPDPSGQQPTGEPPSTGGTAVAGCGAGTAAALVTGMLALAALRSVSYRRRDP